MRRALASIAACWLAGCASAPLPPTETPVPSSARDPAPYLPPPSSSGETGTPVGLAMSGGDEQARQLLVRLVIAMRDADEAEISRMLAERIGHAGGAQRTTWPRASQARQLASRASTTALDPDAPFDTLVDPTTIRVVQASLHYTTGLPMGVVGTDLVVVFQPTQVGRRALGGLAGGLLVVRPGPEPVVVAR